MNQIISKDREFYKTFIKLTIPIAMQNLIATSLNLVDNVMIGQMGETQIAAVSLANQIFFLLNMFLFGTYSGAAIFTAQFWGIKDIKNIRRILGLGLIAGITFSVIFTIPSLFVPEWVLSLYSNDPEVIALGSRFLRIMCLSFIPMSISFSYSFILRSTEQVKIPMQVSAFALGLNTILGYTLIFGKFGFPALGVEGAAIAILIARTVEVATILTIVYKRNYVPAAKLTEMLDLSVEFIKRFFYTTIPVILNESLWGFGVTMYSVVYARMGTGIIAAVNIASTIERIAFVFFFGMGHACAVMVGKQIGAGDEKKAFTYAKKFIKLDVTIGIGAGLLLIAIAPLALTLFNITPDAYDNARRLLTLAGLLMWIRGFNMLNIVGILRSGGDTKFSLFLEASGIWCIAVPMAVLGGLVWKLPLQWVYLLIALEEVYKSILGFYRFASKKWINNLVRNM